MRLISGVTFIGLVSLLGVAVMGCASSSKPAETPSTAAAEESAPPREPALQGDFEASMEFGDGEAEPENEEGREEYIPPPTQTYSPAAKLKSRDAGSK